MRRTLVLIADPSVECGGKSAFSPPLDIPTAEQLRECLVLDLLEKAQSTPDAEILILRAQNDTKLSDIIPGPDGYIHNDEEDGDTVESCFEQLCEHDRSVIALHSENPTLPAMSLELAFDILDTCKVDVVLGPSENGGCYLIGMKTCHEGLFSGIDIDSPTALERIIERCADRNLDWYLLPKWHSLFNKGDLNLLTNEILSARETGQSAQHTRKFLGRLSEAGKI